MVKELLLTLMEEKYLGEHKSSEFHGQGTTLGSNGQKYPGMVRMGLESVYDTESISPVYME